MLAALYAFFQEHRYSGDLEAAVENDYVWMTCTCGAAICLPTEPKDESLTRPARSL